MSTPAPTWRRIDGIDLLRGLAILFVLLNHVNMRLLFAKVPYTHGLPTAHSVGTALPEVD